MDVIFITTVDINGQLGDSTHVREVISNLSRQVNSILVLSRNSYCNKFKVGNIKFKKVYFIKFPLLMSPTFNVFAIIFCLFILLTSKYDVIYERHHIMGAGCVPAKIFKIPYIVEVNGLLLDESKRKGIIRKIMGKIEILTFSMADKIVVVTSGIKKALQTDYKIPENKLIVIENAANTELFRPIDQKAERKKMNLQDKANYICFVGHLVYWQGVKYLIQSAPLISKESSNTNFIVIGDGPLKKELMELAEKTGVSDMFIFTGTVSYEDVPKYINASDVCVVPKKPLKSGYSPLKLYEYMACGKPVVASNLPGFKILAENNAGILAEPENPEELSKAIVKLLKDEKLRDEMGKNGREYVVKNHSWESVARRVAKVCEEAIREHKK